MTDAIPKKRGPKTDMLEALLKRVDGLERRFQDEQKLQPPINGSAIKNGDDSYKENRTNISDVNNVSVEEAQNVVATQNIISSRKQKKGSISSLNTNAFQSNHLGCDPSSKSILRDCNSQSIISRSGGQPPSMIHSQAYDHVQSLSDSTLNTFFSRINGKPFYFLDEATTRQRHRTGHLPVCLTTAIHAITTRYVLLPLCFPYELSLEPSIN